MGLRCESPFGSSNSGLQEWTCSLRLNSSNSLLCSFSFCLEIWCQAPYWGIFPIVSVVARSGKSYLFFCIVHWFLTTAPNSAGLSFSDWCHLSSLGCKPSLAFCNSFSDCSNIRRPSLCQLLTGISASPGLTHLFLLFVTVVVSGMLMAKYSHQRLFVRRNPVFLLSSGLDTLDQYFHWVPEYSEILLFTFLLFICLAGFHFIFF